MLMLMKMLKRKFGPAEAVAMKTKLCLLSRERKSTHSILKEVFPHTFDISIKIDKLSTIRHSILNVK